MYIDLTQTTLEGKEYRLGSQAYKVEKISCETPSGSTYNTYEITCATHNMGTHIDTIALNTDMPLERLIGLGTKFDVSHLNKSVIELDDLDLSLPIKDRFIFFQTNWDNYLTDHEKYLKHPEISFEIIEYLVSKGANMIGIDALGLGQGKNHGKIDVYLGQEKKYAIENLTNLKDLPPTDFKVMCLPIKMENIDVLPARIIAEV